MKFFKSGKDGGPDSTVTGYWLVEIKRLFSIAVLRFDDGSRYAYHSHAFNSTSWVLSGLLKEKLLGAPYDEIVYWPSWRPIRTLRSTFHRVKSEGATWVLTFRGPWAKRWREFDPFTNKFSTLENGRVVVEEHSL